MSFFGFGVQPPTPTWGNLLNEARQWLDIAPWLAIPPGLLIFATVLCVNALGDGLRDAFDTRARWALPSSSRMQALKCPGATSSSGGTMAAQSGRARGQRVRNKQPLGEFSGLGRSPVRMLR